MISDIDTILDLLDWNNIPEEQQRGLEMAREVKALSVFVLPGTKSKWENSAFILAEKTDKELEPILYGLMYWLSDLNWPGALIILRRLKRFEQSKLFIEIYENTLGIADYLDKEQWKENLKEIKREEKPFQTPPESEEIYINIHNMDQFIIKSPLCVILNTFVYNPKLKTFYLNFYSTMQNISYWYQFVDVQSIEQRMNTAEMHEEQLLTMTCDKPYHDDYISFTVTFHKYGNISIFAKHVKIIADKQG